jgi:single-stranded-DNA-specific exonuclease
MRWRRADRRRRPVDAFGRLPRRAPRRRIRARAATRALLLDAVLAPRRINPAVVDAMEAGGPYGMGWPAPRVAAGPVTDVKGDVVGTDHVRLIVAGDDGAASRRSPSAAETELGQTLLHRAAHRKLWLAGPRRIDDWGSRPAAELHIEDAAWAD